MFLCAYIFLQWRWWWLIIKSPLFYGGGGINVGPLTIKPPFHFLGTHLFFLILSLSVLCFWSSFWSVSLSIFISTLFFSWEAWNNLVYISVGWAKKIVGLNKTHPKFNKSSHQWKVSMWWTDSTESSSESENGYLHLPTFGCPLSLSLSLSELKGVCYTD